MCSYICYNCEANCTLSCDSENMESPELLNKGCLSKIDRQFVKFSASTEPMASATIPLSLMTG